MPRGLSLNKNNLSFTIFFAFIFIVFRKTECGRRTERQTNGLPCEVLHMTGKFNFLVAARVHA
jgi:hypothetical protein